MSVSKPNSTVTLKSADGTVLVASAISSIQPVTAKDLAKLLAGQDLINTISVKIFCDIPTNVSYVPSQGDYATINTCPTAPMWVTDWDFEVVEPHPGVRPHLTLYCYRKITTP